MVEAGQVRPGFHGVARFATGHASIGTLLSHLVAEFAMMGILVAAIARAILEMVTDHLLGSRTSNCRRIGRVTFRARDSQMRRHQWKAGLLVLRNGVSRGLKTGDGVALLATIVVRRRGELPIVWVLVAFGALREGDLISRRRARRHVAFRAFNLRVLALQRIGRGGMFLHSECCGFPAIDHMARRAFSLVPARAKLPAMLVLVAIHAFGEGHRLLEIRIGVALGALNVGVFAQQGKFRPGMVELLGGSNLFPAVRGVARFAGLRKSTVMYIGVAIRTLSKGDAGEPCGASWLRRSVALLTGDLRVQAGEWEACFRMIDFCGRFPVGEIVALQAVRTELVVVYIFVASGAILR